MLNGIYMIVLEIKIIRYLYSNRILVSRLRFFLFYNLWTKYWLLNLFLLGIIRFYGSYSKFRRAV
jgi:hypothetical protein